jgi:TolB-like protein/Flp pilus assembly protein TadD
MPLTPGTRIGAYEVVYPLGAGGMGEVYRARDTRLGRDVALKVLPPDVTSDPSRLERFDREARAIAALNHPHIVTLYSTEDVEGVRFLTMELVEGQTLTELIVAGGLPIDRFLDIALQLADALSAAHQKNITHRDLKPGNVMVSREGRVKVLDFGLARLGHSDIGQHSIAATQAPITHLGMIVGTMPYMSPEQVEGQPLDPRSDLFSLGVIFYELLNGERPFKGASSPALMSAILRDTPSSVSDARTDVPEPLARLVSRCLEKRPEDRVQTARDVYNELRHVQRHLESGARLASHARAVQAMAETLRIVVLPFTVRGADADSEAVALGLTEDVTASLAKFHGLSVAAPQAARAFKDSTADARQVAERLGARYVVGGSVRKSSSAVRVTAHLIDAHSATQLWSETYDRQLEGSDIFTIQDDVTDHIVATVADADGVLTRSMVRTIRQHTTIAQSTADQLLLRARGFQHNPFPADHAELRAALESMAALQPDNANVWAMLADFYVAEHSLWFNPLPDPLGRALRAARRAVELDHTHQEGWQWLAISHFYLRDRTGFEEAAARAIRVNPRNAHTMAWIGNAWTYAGEYDRGCTLTERAMAINAGHAGWLHLAVFNRHFARGEYADALHAARRVNIPGFVLMHFAIAAAAGHLGLAAEGKAAADAMVKIAPQLREDGQLREFVTRRYWPEDLIESLLEGVQRSQSFAQGAPEQAGKRPPSGASPAGAPATAHVDSDSGSSSAFLINVRPFDAQGADADSLAAGLTQSIVVGLSRYAYLRVIARSTAPAAVATGYVLQGSVRIAGNRVRTVTQLTEAASGASLWAETYDRDLGSTSLFEMQDALTATIVATIADANGALVRSMANVVRRKPADALTPYEAVLWRLAYVSVVSPGEHAQVRAALESATTRVPEYGAAWAALATIYVDEYAQGFNPRPEPLARARVAAHKALECDPSNQQAYVALALIAFFARDTSSFQAAKDRALALNPLDTGAMSLLGALTAYSGDWDAGLALSEKAMSLNPHHPGVYRMTSIFNRYRLRDYSGALDLLNRVTMPNYPNALVVRAAVYGQLGRLDEGRALVRDAEARMPGITDRHDNARRKWLPKALADHIQEGLDKLSPAHHSSDYAAAAPASATAEASIAVLPFTDLSATKDQDWFCDGVAEEILNALAPLPGLRVAGRASSFSLRGSVDDLRAIGERLNVNTVLEGSVRRAGDRVRITAQLSDTAQGRQLWSERFDRELKDIFDVQDEIARAIVERLKVTLVGGSRDRLVPKATANIDAYELLLKGRVLLTRRGRAILDAMAHFERAVDLDPQLAEAHALLGDAHRLVALYGLAPARESMPRARACVERALAIDPHQVEALATLANIASTYDWDIAAAVALSDRALAVDPSHVRALAERGISLVVLEALPLAQQQRILNDIRRARELDPLNAWVLAVESLCLACLGNLPEAVAVAERAVAMDEDNFTARWTLVVALAMSGRHTEAHQAATPALALSGRHPRILAELANLHAADGEADAAEAIHVELRNRAAASHIGFAERAAVAASAGHAEEARRLVSEAIAARDPYLRFWKFPAWRAVWNDPDCAAMLRATALQH